MDKILYYKSFSLPLFSTTNQTGRHSYHAKGREDRYKGTIFKKQACKYTLTHISGEGFPAFTSSPPIMTLNDSFHPANGKMSISV